MICIGQLNLLWAGAGYFSFRSQVQLGNEMKARCASLSRFPALRSSPDKAASYQEKSGRAGIGVSDLFKPFQGVAQISLPVDFLEPVQTLA